MSNSPSTFLGFDKKIGQMNLAFANSPQGGEGAGTGGELPGKAYLLHKARSRRRSDLLTRAAPKDSELLEEAASERNMATALLNVLKNKGAPGVDGKSVEEVVAAAPRLLPKLRHELLSGKYHPSDVRRGWIPKPGGGQRGLGIPNAIDRLVQQAVLQVMEPIFAPTFHRSRSEGLS